ncbi:hypothetical protein H8D40_02205 [Candidatus Bathyarchaeota archaeon]|nr:hypothetical protein [Candidatus Bathyarchaeota archaeon]
MLKRRRGVSTLIGVAFFLLIFMTGFTYYALTLQARQRYDVVVQEMSEFDRGRFEEELTVTDITVTALNKINITAVNPGSSSVHVVWIGIMNEANNTQDYYDADIYVKPAETQTGISNDSITVYADQTFIMHLVTELGNIYTFTYFPDTGSGGGETRYHYVDAFTDDYAPAAQGAPSFFSAQQYGPDGIMDVMTEASTSTGLQNTTMISGESFEGIWSPAGWTETPGDNNWNQESDQAYDGIFSADFDGQNPGRTGNLETPDLDLTGASSLYLEFWYRDDDLDPNEFMLEFFDGTTWDLIEDLGFTIQEDQWLHYSMNISDPQYFIGNFRIRWNCDDVENGETAFLDLVTVTKEVLQTNYDLDLEVSWSDVAFNEDNEWLCIYGGVQGPESLIVDAWDGGAWATVFNDLQPGWNNADVSTYLTSSTFTIRFRGGVAIGDTVQDSWEVDTTFLHVWTYTPP